MPLAIIGLYPSFKQKVEISALMWYSIVKSYAKWQIMDKECFMNYE